MWVGYKDCYWETAQKCWIVSIFHKFSYENSGKFHFIFMKERKKKIPSRWAGSKSSKQTRFDHRPKIVTNSVILWFIKGHTNKRTKKNNVVFVVDPLKGRLQPHLWSTYSQTDQIIPIVVALNRNTLHTCAVIITILRICTPSFQGMCCRALYFSHGFMK